MQWRHLEHTQYLIEQLKALEVPITVVMESTSTYGDSLRYQCRQAGFSIYQANAKKVHDAREIYDGVPSLHDAKAAWLIAKLHKDGATKPWCEPAEEEQSMNALRLEYELHQDQYLRNQNRLEAYLSRHWPEELTISARVSVWYFLSGFLAGLRPRPLGRKERPQQAKQCCFHGRGLGRGAYPYASS